MPCSLEPGSDHHVRSKSRIASSRVLRDIATSFATAAFNYKHCACSASGAGFATPPAGWRGRAIGCANMGSVRPTSETAEELAARLRAERAAIVEEIAAGAVAVDAIGTDPRAAAVKVVVLAQALPGVGKVRSRRVLEALAVDDGVPWGQLPPSVEARVVAALRETAAATADDA